MEVVEAAVAVVEELAAAAPGSDLAASWEAGLAEGRAGFAKR